MYPSFVVDKSNDMYIGEGTQHTCNQQYTIAIYKYTSLGEGTQ